MCGAVVRSLFGPPEWQAPATSNGRSTSADLRDPSGPHLPMLLCLGGVIGTSSLERAVAHLYVYGLYSHGLYHGLYSYGLCGYGL